MGKELNPCGNIFDIQGFSVHDGPGCRTLIFLKGCTMQCFWCSNPEGIHPKPEPIYFHSKCILDKNCIEACGHNAISTNGSRIEIDRTICHRCGDFKCVENCFTGALKTNGKKITMKELTATIQRDRQYWGEKGGITLTGGEPLLQIEFTESLLRECYNAFIHTAIETCGNVPQNHYKRIAPYTEWIIFDLKHMDDTDHKRGTGISNSQVLNNAAWLAENFEGKLLFRLPLIPGFNDSNENIDATAAFLTRIGIHEINVLPLHHLGREKYRMLDLTYTADNTKLSTPEHLDKIQNRFVDKGIDCWVGADTPF